MFTLGLLNKLIAPFLFSEGVLVFSFTSLLTCFTSGVFLDFIPPFFSTASLASKAAFLASASFFILGSILASFFICSRAWSTSSLVLAFLIASSVFFLACSLITSGLDLLTISLVESNTAKVKFILLP